MIVDSKECFKMTRQVGGIWVILPWYWFDSKNIMEGVGITFHFTMTWWGIQVKLKIRPPTTLPLPYCVLDVTHPIPNTCLTLMLIWPIQTIAKVLERRLKPCHMGTHLRILSEGYPMNNNMTGFRCFSKIFAFLSFGRSSLSIGRVKDLSRRLWQHPAFRSSCTHP